MALTRDDFRRLLATSAGRTELGLKLTSDQAAQILANDALLDSWYRKVSAAGVPPAPLPSPPARDSEPAVAAKHTPTVLDRWKATSRKQRLIAGAIAGGLVLLIIGTVVTANVVGAAQQAASEQAAEDAAAAREAALAVEEAAAELEEAHTIAGRFLTNDRDKVEAPVPAWADPAAFADQQSAYAALEQANRGDDTDAINDAISKYRIAKDAVGTEEQVIARQEADAKAARDKQYIDSLNAAGQYVGVESISIDQAITFCESLTNDNFKLARVLNAMPKESLAIPVYCPEFNAIVEQARTAFDDGNHVVADTVGPGKILPGTYRTEGGVANCYWERHTGAGEILENDFITHAPDGVIVTVYPGEGLSTQGCNVWVKVG